MAVTPTVQIGDEVSRRDYGSGSVYQRASDGRWVATVEAGWTRNGTRRRPARLAKTEAEAKRKLRDLLREVEDGKRSGPDRRMTVKAWAEKWLEATERTSRPSTFTTEKGAVNAWIVPTIGHRRLGDLDADDILAVTKALRAAGKSTSTAQRYQSVLSRMLKAAARAGHTISQSAMLADKPERSVSDRQAIPVTQTLTLLERASHLPHGSRWAIAFLQGLRQGESLGLTRDCIDLERGLLRVEWQLQPLPYLDKRDRSKGHRVPDSYEARHLVDAYHLVRPKTKKGYRVIPLIPWAADALAVWLERAPANPWGLVWPAADGRPQSKPDDTAEWRRLQAIEPALAHPSGRPWHIHEIRHATATLLMELGVEESVRIAIMGHSSIAVTRGYEFVDTAALRTALEAAGQRLGEWRALGGGE